MASNLSTLDPAQSDASSKANLKLRLNLGPWVRIGAVILGVVGLVSGAIWALTTRSNQAANTLTNNFAVTRLPLDKLAVTAAEDTHTLKVNGDLQIGNSLILAPIARPETPALGQLYFDRDTNRLAYYNGQQFTELGNTINNITNITNSTTTGTTSAAPSSVRLQATAPGIQQTGSFNISGTGAIGTLKTSVIDSSSQTLYINPINSSLVSAPSPGGQNATMGLTSIGSFDTGANLNNVLIATKITMGNTGGSAKSISVYITGGNSSNRIQVGLYDDDGDLPSKPGNLLAASAYTNLVPNAFNTLTIPSTGLTPNTTYWLAFNTNDSTLSRPYNNNNKTSCFVTLGAGFMPDPFSAPGCFHSNELYSIYLNYVTNASTAGSFGQAQVTISSTGQTVFQNSEDSSTAFQIQNATGTTTVFNVDTANGRIAIGKATAAYKLDIAAGDINLSNARSIRFAGLQALTVNSGGTVTSLTNFSSGGSVVAQGDNFIVQDANGTHQNLEINNLGAAIFSNRTDSATAFQVQNATGTSLLQADTTGMKIMIGNPAGDANPVVLYLANKNTSDDPVGAEGGTYYNSTLASFRCYYAGFWHNCADADPGHSFSLRDEFLGGQTSFTGPIGSLNWTAIAIGANGSLALNPNTPVPSSSRPGVLRLQTPATIGQGTTLTLGDTTAGSTIIAKDNHVKTGLAVGASTGAVVRAGLHTETSTTSQPLSGVWWEANPAADANWRYCYGDGATATCAASAVAIAANTWVSLETRVTATGAGTSAATFVINNTPFQVTAATIDTTNQVSPSLTCFTTAASSQNCYFDYFQFTGTTTAR